MRSAQRFLKVLLMFALATTLAPTAAQAVSFSGPTTYTAGGGPAMVAADDLNGDSIPDLAVANGDGDVSILLGAGDGTFDAPTNFATNFGAAGPISIATGDFDGDSSQDLAVAGTCCIESGNIVIMLNNGDATFTRFPVTFHAGISPVAVAVGDFDGDSNLDLVVAAHGACCFPAGLPATVSVLLGNGDGTFAGPVVANSGGQPESVAVGYLNGDSNLDAAVATAGNQVLIMLGNGDGTFTTSLIDSGGQYPLSIAIGDFNGDSKADLAVGGGGLSILLGNGDGTFTEPNELFISCCSGRQNIAIGDFNSDSRLDLALGDSYFDDHRIWILLGNGDGSFDEQAELPVSGFPTTVVARDLNGDSRDDLVGESENVFVFLNTTFLGYARPLSATPITARLVPAFNQCTSANSTHGAPLAAASCNPPAQTSSFLTFNAPDRPAPYNTAASGTAGLTMTVFCTDGAAPPCTAQAGDQQDVKLDSKISGVRCAGSSGGCSAAGGTYSGKLLVSTTLRITDRLSGPSLQETATVSDTPLQFGIQCAAGTCNSSTSADAVIPGIAKEQKRAIWELSQIEVLDGGSDGNLVAAPSPASGSCPPACVGNGGETVFLRQGLFAP